MGKNKEHKEDLRKFLEFYRENSEVLLKIKVRENKF